MSNQSVTICTQDTVLQDRVTAGAMRESYSGGDEFSKSAFAAQLQRTPGLALNYFMWPVAIDYEEAYEYALNTDNPSPGGDVGVISDGNIQAVVQLNWPRDAVQVPQTEMFPPEEQQA